MKKRLISISGLDGAGKTSVIEELIDIAASSDISTKRVWGAYELILLRPIIRMGQFLFLRKYDQFMNYREYHNCIRSLSQRRLLSKPYEILTLLEYCIQVFLKITIPHVLSRKVIVCDRYYFDVLVSLAVTLSHTESKLRRRLEIFSRLCPRPDYAFLLDVPEEVAFNRKDDLPSIKYLGQRRNLYIEVAKEYGMEILDGTNNIETNAEIIFNNAVKEG